MKVYISSKGDTAWFVVLTLATVAIYAIAFPDVTTALTRAITSLPEHLRLFYR